MKPEIIERIVVVWLGGHALNWPHTREFNLKQDVPAAQLVFDCGVPMVMLPCMGVTSHLQTTIAELEAYVSGQGEIGDYLVEIVKATMMITQAGLKLSGILLQPPTSSIQAGYQPCLFIAPS